MKTMNYLPTFGSLECECHEASLLRALAYGWAGRQREAQAGQGRAGLLVAEINSSENSN